MGARRGRVAVAAGRWVTEPLISIVVPVLDEAEELPAFLEHLQAWRPLAELILVDGGSADATVAIATPLVDRVVQVERGRARQMNAGAAHARGRYLLFLHCDTCLSIAPGDFAAELARAPGWGFCRVKLSGSDWRLRIVEAAMNLRSKLSRVATGDQCLFVERSLWAQTGGFASIPLMEDIEICKRLRRIRKPHIIADAVVTSSRRWERRGVLPTVLLMWRLRLAFWLGVPPARLVKKYHA
jgi:rSAM/selenodomain-associated transferase 2